MLSNNKINNSLEDKTEEETGEEELEPEIPIATAKVALKTAPWEESASMRGTLSMLEVLPDWTILTRRGTQVCMRDHSKPDIMGTKEISETEIRKELD